MDLIKESFDNAHYNCKISFFVIPKLKGRNKINNNTLHDFFVMN